MAVAREGAGVADVADAQQFGGEALGPDGEAAVGGHAVLEDLGVAFQRCGVQFVRGDGVHQHGVVVDALPAGRDLDAPEQQVEPAREVRVEAAVGVVVGVRVEGPGSAGVLGHEHEVAALRFGVVLAEQPFGFRVEVFAAHLMTVLLGDQFAGVQQRDTWNVRRHVGKGGVQQRELGLAPLLQPGHDGGEQAVFQTHHVFLVLDEAHFHVQRQVLVQVAAGGVLLGAVHGRDLEHALEHAHHDLLVKLRTLRQVRRLTEVVNGKQVRAALRACRDDLGRADLGEAFLTQVVTEGRHQFGLHLQRGAFLQAAHRDHAVIQHGFGVHVPFHFGNLDRGGFRGGGDHPEVLHLHLEPPGRFGVGFHGAGHLDAALGQGQVQAAADALRDAAHVAQHQELHAPQVAAGVQETLHFHGLPLVLGQFSRERSGHGLSLGHEQFSFIEKPPPDSGRGAQRHSERVP